MAANSAGSPATAAATAARSLTSSASGRTCGPNSDASSSTRSARRAAATTRAPSAANRRATAAPKPLLAPVTKTVLTHLVIVSVASDRTTAVAQFLIGDCQSVGCCAPGMPDPVSSAVNPTPVRVAPSAASAVIAFSVLALARPSPAGLPPPTRCRR